MWNSLIRHQFGLGQALGRIVRAPDVDEGPLVAHGVTIIGGGEHCDALAIVADFIAGLFDLVAAHDVVQPVVVKETLRHIRAELAAHASFGR